MAIGSDTSTINTCEAKGDWTGTTFSNPDDNNSGSSTPIYLEGTGCMQATASSNTAGSWHEDTDHSLASRILVWWCWFSGPTELSNLGYWRIQLFEGANRTGDRATWDFPIVELQEGGGGWYPLRVWATQADIGGVNFVPADTSCFSLEADNDSTSNDIKLIGWDYLHSLTKLTASAQDVNLDDFVAYDLSNTLGVANKIGSQYQIASILELGAASTTTSFLEESIAILMDTANNDHIVQFNFISGTATNFQLGSLSGGQPANGCLVSYTEHEVTNIWGQFTNNNASYNLNDANKGVSQGWDDSGSTTLGGRADGLLRSVTFELSKTGTPTGNAYAKVYAFVSGISDAPYGTPLAVSDPLDVSTLTGTVTETTLFFSGADANLLIENAEAYVMSLEYDNGTASNYISVDYKSGSGGNTPGLMNSKNSSGVWSEVTNSDVHFNLGLVTWPNTDIFNNIANADTFKLYDTTFVATGEVDLPTSNASREVLGCKFTRCEEIKPSTVKFEDNIVLSAPNRGLLFSSTANVKDTQFIGCNVGVHINTAGTYTFDNLVFAGNTYDVENSANATTVDSYAETNRNGDQVLGNGTIIGVAQSFDGGTTTRKLTNVRFYLSKTGSPTGNAVAKLYAISGALGGGDDIPTGAALATSENFDVSTLSTDPELQQFIFTDEVNIVSGTDYVIALEYSNGDTTNHVLVGRDSTTPTATGNMATLTGSTWSAVSGTDVCFYVSGDGLVIVNATNGANPSSQLNSGSPPGAVVVKNSVTILIHAVDAISGADVQGARVYLFAAAGGPLTAGDDILFPQSQLTDVNGEVSETFNYTADQPVSGWVRRGTTTPLYKTSPLTGTITVNGLSLTAALVLDE